MPRVGRHPLKVKGLTDRDERAEITFATITHVPTLEGYWEQSLEVLDVFFSRVRDSTQKDLEVIVFDNNSCERVRGFLQSLQNSGLISCLVLSSRNLRKLGALDILISMSRGEYFGYSDSDVYLQDGWLEKSIEVFQAFPSAGKVTAIPIAGGDCREISKAIYQEVVVDPDIDVETGRLIPDAYLAAHAAGLDEDLMKFSGRLTNRCDVRVTSDGVSAYLSGADFQFLLNRQAAQAVAPLGKARAEEYYDPIYSPVLERRLNEAHFWQLSTTDYLVHHMGNALPDLAREVPFWAPDKALGKRNVPAANARHGGWVKSTTLRSILRRIYVFSYRALFD